VILGTAKFWMPILIAAGVAVHEADRRKKQEQRRLAGTTESNQAKADTADGDEAEGDKAEGGEADGDTGGQPPGVSR
jgi:hypothetical protein